MAGQIAEAYVQIIPTTDGIASGISKSLGGEGESSGKSFSGGFIRTATKLLAAAGVGKIIKSALDAGGAVQQSFGGLETIYVDAAKGAQEHARAAAAAGISMNTYAEQAVSVGAALKQAYSGDTTKAMEAANTAILDMADNAAKMGTPIESVQAAYQGFAKGQYQLLDNLKLGYGGTKTEMERLLADAEKLTGVKYDINNVGDVYEAIHVIQGQLGLTGVAAAEAAGTFTGSMGAMKAAASNFLADLALGNDISGSLSVLTSSVVTFAKNLIPMLVNVIGQAPAVIVQLLQELGPLLITEGGNAIIQLAQGFADALPGLIAAITELIPQLVSAFLTILPQLIPVALQIIMALQQGLIAALPQLIAALPGLITQLVDGIVSNVPLIVEAGIQLFLGLVQALPEIAMALVEAAPDIVMALIEGLLSMAGALINGAVQLFTGIVDGLKQVGPQILDSAKQHISNTINKIKSMGPQLLAAAKSFAASIPEGIKSALGKVNSAVIEIGTKVVTGIKNFASQLVSAGKNLILGLANGIKQGIANAVAAARQAGQSVIAAAKAILGIHSPSTVFAGIGENITLGLAQGIMEDTKPVTDAIDNVAAMTTAGMDNALAVNAALGVSTDAEATGDLRTLIAVVNALSRKIDNIGVYLDGDRMVGGLVDRMDNALGNRALLVGRGQA